MKNLSKVQKMAGIILAACIVLTLVIIFGNSLKSQEESGNQSQKVVDIVKPILDSDNSIPEDIFELVIRKTGHVLEFMLLAIETMLLYISLTKKLPSFSHIPSIILFIISSALADETVQIISERGSSTVDVWIDTFGGFLGIVFVFAIFNLIKISKKSKQTVDKQRIL